MIGGLRLGFFVMMLLFVMRCRRSCCCCFLNILFRHGVLIMVSINWSLFESKFWSPNKGEGYNLVLANWRQEIKSFDDGKTEKPVIVFDILKIGEEELSLGSKTFVTAAASFAEDARPIIEAAESRGERAINVYLEYSKDKRYRVLDMKLIKGAYNNSVVREVHDGTTEKD